MSQQFEVTYALSNDPNATATSAFQSRSDMNNLKMVVEAVNTNQARMIVENMFGGRVRCQALSAYPK